MPGEKFRKGAAGGQHRTVLTSTAAPARLNPAPFPPQAWSVRMTFRLHYLEQQEAQSHVAV